jgi:hypothetical protein
MFSKKEDAKKQDGQTLVNPSSKASIHRLSLPPSSVGCGHVVVEVEEWGELEVEGEEEDAGKPYKHHTIDHPAYIAHLLLLHIATKLRGRSRNYCSISRLWLDL